MKITINICKFVGEFVCVFHSWNIIRFHNRLSSPGRDSCQIRFLRAPKDVGATGKTKHFQPLLMGKRRKENYALCANQLSIVNFES